MGARRGWALAAACLWAAGCDDTRLRKAEAELVVSEPSLDWGLVALGERAVRTLSLRNAGVAAADLSGLSAPAPFSVREFPAGGLSLAPGEERTFQLVFTPAIEGPAEASAWLEAGTGPVEIGLSGEGVAVHAVVDPASLSFGPVPLGGERRLDVVLRNDGRIALRGTVALEGPDADEFGLAAQDFEVAPGAQGSVSVAFHPNHVGLAEAAARVVPCASCEPVRVALAGEGVASCLELSPAAIDFGSLPVGASDTRLVKVLNPGTTTLDVTEVFLASSSSPDFQVTGFSADAPRRLAPGAGLTLTVGLTPSGQGPRAGAVRVRASGVASEGCWAELRLKGTGGEGCLVVHPEAVDFGVVAIGMSQQRRVQIANAACGADVRVDGVEVVGDAAFSAGPARVPPFVLKQSEVLEVLVGYSPTANVPSQAALHLTASDPVSGRALTHPPPDVPLYGTSRALAPCSFTMVPPRLDFGSVTVGRSARLGFRLTNVGQDACYFSNVALTRNTAPEFTLEGGSPGFALAAGDSLDLTVRFQPSAEASFAGALEGYVSDPSAPYRIWPVSGRGDQGCLSIDPTDVDFGTVLTGCPPPTRVATVTNRCSADQPLADLVRGAGTSTEFTLATAAAFPMTLRAGGQLLVGIQYAPVDDGPDSMPLYLDDGTVRHLIAVRGRGLKDPWRTDAFDQIARQKVDVLFVLDNSGSMADKQAALAANLASFLRTAQMEGVDYHLAVTTTGIIESDGGWADCPGGVHGGEAGRLFPADGSSPRILTTATPDPRAVWTAMTNVGTCHWLEQGLEASYRALTTPLVDRADLPGTAQPADGNLGFYRPEAKLAVVYVSDEDDQSNAPVATYLAFLKGLKPDASLLTVSAIVTPSDLNRCMTGTSSGLRYIELVKALGGLVESICTPDWSASLQRLGDNTFGLNSLFPLSAVPSDPARIEVTVDGAQVTLGWTYDASGNAVIFLPGFVPEAGTHVEIRYPVGCR